MTARMTTASVSQTELAALIAGLTTPLPAAPGPGRCPVTDLLVDQCAHCRPTPSSQARQGLGPWFPATYKGSCDCCGSEFDPGERIRASADGWLADCCGDIDTGRPATQPPMHGLLTPAVAALVPARAARPCDDPFCGPGGCGWPPVDHVPAATGGRDIIAASTAPKPAPTPTITAAPAPTSRREDPPPSTVALMRQVLDDLDRSRPRSRQTALGPSELGTPCQRQIAYKLVGAQRRPEDKRPPWAPMQGTAMHALMEETLHFHNQQLGRQRWIVEERLEVDPGLPGLDPITGHGDAYDTDHGCVVDWKYVGITTLRDVKRKTIPNEQLVKPDYRVQAHLYGLGHERAGRDVRWVRLVFLARSHDYADSAEWTEPYQPDIALQAVYRYYGTHDLIAALNLAEQPQLWPVVPAAPGKSCDWCPFRRVGGPADATGCPGDTDAKIDKQTAGLIA